MSLTREINVLNTNFQMPELLLATGFAGRGGTAGSSLGPSGLGLASIGWARERCRQASVSEQTCRESGVIDDAAETVPFEGRETWLSLVTLTGTVFGAVFAYLMWVSGPGFLVAFALLLFAGAPFYLKGLEALAGIHRKKEKQT
ncbi:MAG: hypothetical protein V7703_01805 [Hyphomicrobiales bacterium]